MDLFYRPNYLVDSLQRESVHETPQIVLTLGQFIENCGNPEAIQAILDCPSGTGQHPILVGQVVSLVDMLFSHSFYSHVDDGYIAVDKTKAYFKQVPVDMKGSRVWVILHQPLFHTYIHHDASGTGTWTSISSGNKFWVFAIPKNDGGCTSLASLHEHNSQYMLSENNPGEWSYTYPANSERFCIFGKGGDMM